MYTYINMHTLIGSHIHLDRDSNTYMSRYLTIYIEAFPVVDANLSAELRACLQADKKEALRDWAPSDGSENLWSPVFLMLCVLFA